MTRARLVRFRRLRIALAFLCLTAVLPLTALGQTAACCRTGEVVNAEGTPVANASILDASGKLLAKTAADGSFSVPANVTRIEVAAAHFAPVYATTSESAPVRVVVQRPLETVVVSA